MGKGVGPMAPAAAFFGDYLIRAYINGDTASAPILNLGATQVLGAAPPDGADTVTTTIQNTGTGCDLRYKVRVNQTGTRFGSSDGLIPGNDPRTLGFGGPDAFGYTWKDSDDQPAPISSGSISTRLAPK